MPKESDKATITAYTGAPLVRVVDGLNSRNISPANLVGEAGAAAALDARHAVVFGVAAPTGVLATDTAAIQTQIDAAEAAGGGSVVLRYGSYLVSTLTINSNNVSLVGQGRGSVITSAANATIVNVGSCSNITLTDFAVVCTGAGASQSAILCTNLTNSVFRGLFIVNPGYDGILLLSNCVGVTVAQCIVTGCGDDGINIGAQPLNPTRNCTVIGNTVTGCVSDGIHVSEDSEDNTVTGNTVRDCGGGISLYKTKRVTVTGNTVDNSTTYGIFVPNGPSTDFVISDNLINGGTRGIDIRFSSTRYVISNNVIAGASEYGILISEGSQFRVDASIIGNLIYDGCSASGILLGGCSRVIVSANTVTTVDSYGIQVNLAEKVQVLGNSVDAVGVCIYVPSSALSAHVSVKDNSLFCAGGRGIEFRGGAYFDLSGNRILAASDYGILISQAAASYYGRVNDNTITGGCTLAGINIFGTNDVDVIGNIITGITATNEIAVASASRVFVGGGQTNDVSGGLKGIRVSDGLAGTTLGSVVSKVEAFDSSGTSLGFVPVYNTIT